MVSSDHNTGVHPGNAVLRLHTLAGLFVTANKVRQRDAGIAQGFLAGQDRFFDIDRQHAVRLDKVDGILAVLLIRLHTIRQTHGNKLVSAISGLFTQFADGGLTQFAGQGRVLTAADAQYQRLDKGIGFQIRLKKVDAGANFLLNLNGGLNAQRFDNFLLQSHLPLLRFVPRDPRQLKNVCGKTNAPGEKQQQSMLLFRHLLLINQTFSVFGSAV